MVELARFALRLTQRVLASGCWMWKSSLIFLAAAVKPDFSWADMSLHRCPSSTETAAFELWGRRGGEGMGSIVGCRGSGR